VAQLCAYGSQNEKPMYQPIFVFALQDCYREALIMASTAKKIWHVAWPLLVAFVLVPLTIILIYVSILWAISYFESTATQQEMTTTAMDVDKERIFDDIREHQTLPKSLSELPQSDGKIDGTRDGWGRPIIYTIGKNGFVTLVSLGSDGKPGGSGDAADMIQSFPTKDANGNWIVSVAPSK
jgi:hypothetical protein